MFYSWTPNFQKEESKQAQFKCFKLDPKLKANTQCYYESGHSYGFDQCLSYIGKIMATIEVKFIDFKCY